MGEMCGTWIMYDPELRGETDHRAQEEPMGVRRVVRAFQARVTPNKDPENGALP